MRFPRERSREFCAKPRRYFRPLYIFFCFLFKTSLAVHLGTRSLLADRTRRGLHAIHPFISVTQPLTVSGPVLYYIVEGIGASFLLHLSFFSSLSRRISFRVASGLNQLRKGESAACRVTHQLFYRIFTNHAAKHSFRFAIIPQLSPSRIDLSAATLLSAFRCMLGVKGTPQMLPLSIFISVAACIMPRRY